MEVKKEKRVVEVTETTYVAVDGQEFATERDCLQYEAKLELQKRIEDAEQFRIKKLDERMPLSLEEAGENNTFRWYEVRSKEEFDILNKAYKDSIAAPANYPELICVETCGYEAYMDDAYSYNVTGLKKETKNFWETMGYEVTFEKKEDITREN